MRVELVKKMVCVCVCTVWHVTPMFAAILLKRFCSDWMLSTVQCSYVRVSFKTLYLLFSLQVCLRVVANPFKGFGSRWMRAFDLACVSIGLTHTTHPFILYLHVTILPKVQHL